MENGKRYTCEENIAFIADNIRKENERKEKYEYNLAQSLIVDAEFSKQQFEKSSAEWNDYLEHEANKSFIRKLWDRITEWMK